MTTPRHTGNRPQAAVDDSTRLLAPVGKDDDCGNPGCALKRVGIEHRHDRDRGHPVFIRPAEQTAVIPKKIAAIGLLFGAGVVAGIPIGMVLAFVFIVAKVVA